MANSVLLKSLKASGIKEKKGGYTWGEGGGGAAFKLPTVFN